MQPNPAVPPESASPESAGQLALDHLDQEQRASLDEGRRRRDEGMRAAALNTNVPWKRLAQRALSELAASGQPFTAEDLRERVGRPLGSHDSALSSLFGNAARRNEIVACGYTQATRAEARGRVLRVWRGTGVEAP